MFDGYVSIEKETLRNVCLKRIKIEENRAIEKNRESLESQRMYIGSNPRFMIGNRGFFFRTWTQETIEEVETRLKKEAKDSEKYVRRRSAYHNNRSHLSLKQNCWDWFNRNIFFDTTINYRKEFFLAKRYLKIAKSANALEPIYISANDFDLLNIDL